MKRTFLRRMVLYRRALPKERGTIVRPIFVRFDRAGARRGLAERLLQSRIANTTIMVIAIPRTV